MAKRIGGLAPPLLARAANSLRFASAFEAPRAGARGDACRGREPESFLCEGLTACHVEGEAAGRLGSATAPQKIE